SRLEAFTGQRAQSPLEVLAARWARQTGRDRIVDEVAFEALVASVEVGRADPLPNPNGPNSMRRCQGAGDARDLQHWGRFLGLPISDASLRLPLWPRRSISLYLTPLATSLGARSIRRWVVSSHAKDSVCALSAQ